MSQGDLLNKKGNYFFRESQFLTETIFGWFYQENIFCFLQFYKARIGHFLRTKENFFSM